MTRKISKYRLEKAIEHLSSEIIGFWDIFSRLNPDEFKPVTFIQNDLNIFLDSFAIYTRNLFDFFYTKKKYKDDMSVYDYISNRKLFDINKTKERDLTSVVKKVDKYVVHLIYTHKPWPTWATIDIRLEQRQAFGGWPER